MFKLPYHYAESLIVSASPQALFSFVDNHANLSSHMGRSSLMMGGGSMVTEIDNDLGQKVGSHIQLKGKAFGLNIYLDEVVTQHEPPKLKSWETVAYPKLYVIGNYRMGFEITPQEKGSRLVVFIDYELPRGAARLLGFLFGYVYARWCVKQMIASVRKNFVTRQ